MDERCGAALIHEKHPQNTTLCEKYPDNDYSSMFSLLVKRTNGKDVARGARHILSVCPFNSDHFLSSGR
jgi:hypothetical protein